MKKLMTRWGRQLNRTNILPEYPRPQMVRDSYINLNGEWEYCLDARQGKILVPFSPETRLSGVERQVEPGQWFHYRKEFTLPEGFLNCRVLLHFGAVDQECEVYLNYHLIGQHVGGYLEFTFDITPYLCDGVNVLTVHVMDSTEHSHHARGKQKLNKKGRLSYLYYMAQSGIWKTVWMESVPKSYIRKVKVTPLYDESKVCFHIEADNGAEDMSVCILDGEEVIWEDTMPANHCVVAPMSNFEAWSPEHPKLYRALIRWGEDEVRTYFGMRKLSIEPDRKGILRFCLNGRPYFFNGVLDQGYWPESLMTAPTDEALQHDIMKAKELGFNTIRKHVKVEAERFYYHCDRIGMMVWQDMPNGGGMYHPLFVTYLPNLSDWFGRHMRDSAYRLLGRNDKQGRVQYYRDLRGMVGQLYSHPCIAAWVPFNEGWGQFDANRATRLVRKLGGNRIINETSGWFDQKGGDVYSIHNYFHKLTITPQKDRVVALTEFGGYAYEVEEHMAFKKRVGYKKLRTKEAFMIEYAKLWEEQIIPNLKNGLSAVIYTQMSDIEEETNGLMTYDREVDKVDAEIIQEINAALYRRFEEIV